LTDTAGSITISSVDTKYTAGTDLELDGTEFNHSNVTRSNTTSNESPSLNGTFDVVSSVTTSPTGHVTAVNTKTVTLPNETELSVVEEGSGTWVTDIEVDDHEVTLSRSDTTTAKITVGELEVVKASGVSNGNVLIGNDLTVSGNLTVSGTTTTLNTETVNIKDNLIQINSNQEGTPSSSLIGGLEVNRGDETNYQFVFVEATDDFRIGQVGDLQPVLTRDETTNLAEGDILVWDATGNKAIGKAYDELALPNKYAVSITSLAANQTYTITHNLATTDVVYSIKDNTNAMVYADVAVVDANNITVTVGNINSITSLRVVVIG
jgi:hypothetical protein